LKSAAVERALREALDIACNCNPLSAAACVAFKDITCAVLKAATSAVPDPPSVFAFKLASWLVLRLRAAEVDNTENCAAESAAMAAGLSDATKPLLRLAACDVVKPLTDAALIAPTCAGERLASCALLKVPSNLSPMRAIWSVARLKEVVVDIGSTKSIASRMMPHA